MTTEVPRKVEAKNIDEQKPIERRRVSEQLPAVHNTEIIKKFFAGVGDHLFQPEETEKLSGFIGRVPSHAKLEKEFYLAEQTTERTEYQLEPTVVNINAETKLTENILFYPDMANLLRLQGGIVNNHDRLFETDSYSWCPPVDLDKLMNFTNYFWFNTGADVVRITDLTDMGSLIGASNPITIQGVEFFDGMKVIFENDIDFLFENRVFIVAGIGVSFDLIVETSLNTFVWDDIIGWDEGEWDGPDPQLLVENDPDYIVMERGARDGNEWSSKNRWYHRDDLDETQLSIALENQAIRPILEFTVDLELFDHGTFGRDPVTVRDDTTTDPDTQIVGRITPLFIDGIEINNNDTILFTQAPALQGLWDVEAWDLENAPDGIWDPFFGVVYSSPPADIILTETTVGQIVTLSGNFLASGFAPGMPIQMAGTLDQDGEYIIDTVNATTIVLTTLFTGTTGLGVPQPLNVTISENRVEYQNRVFEVSGVGSPGGIVLTLVINGQDLTGAAADGDQIKILLGVVHQEKTYYWVADDSVWRLAQQKTTINQAPLFQLYDTEATKLQDLGKYPLSDFAGSRLFGYQINTDSRQPLDAELGIPLKFNEFGEITFENYLVTERYNFNSPQEEIIGYYFHRQVAELPEDDFFGNDWYLKANRSRQFIADVFAVTDNVTTEFELSLSPQDEDEVSVFVNGEEQIVVTWTFDNNIIKFATPFTKDDQVRVTYFSLENLPDDANGNYEIPDNLEANADNQEVDFTANSDFFAHFTSIISNQEGLEGNPNGTNNWRNTSKDRSLGVDVLQHRAPMLKLMIIGSDNNIDFIQSIRYVEREFSRFRNKFLKKINEFFNDGVHTEAQPASEWVEDALVAINIGKVDSFPFAFSGMGVRTSGEPTYMPSSPSRLGVYPVYEPKIYEDTTYPNPTNVIQMHDGSILIAFNDFRDDAILDFENNIFDSIPDEYKQDVRPDFDLTDFVESEFREGDYTLDEFNQLLIPIIQRWAISNGFDLFTNTTFDINDPLTFNYSAQGLPGYWRGIFKFVYDTDRPNTYPWEMFGFSTEPDWWQDRYGVAPYTSTTPLLWDDMKVGRIAFGSRAGVDEKYARPTAPIPVDGSGDILDPITLGLATQPGGLDAQADWTIGDVAPVESVFRRSEFWSFAISQIGYFMKPARFMEFGWEPAKQLFRYPNQEHPQWLDTSTEDRKRHSEYFVHSEILEDDTRFLSDGIQQWITDFVVSNGQNVTIIFGNILRTVQANLGHRMAGFININSTRIFADNFGLVPSEDISINIYQNPSIREEVYSGVLIERVEEGWTVSGYDILDPIFRTHPGIKSGRKVRVNVGSINVTLFRDFDKDKTIEVPYNTIFETQQEIFDFLIGYGRFLEGKGWIFNTIDQATNRANDWRLAGEQFLFWSLGQWALGSLIAVSPSAKETKFVTEQGAILSIERVVNGVYGILNRQGRAIDPRDTFVARFENGIVITPIDTDAIYSIRLVIAENEHVLTFDNETIFNDLIYDPLYRLRQSRFKIFTPRARGWTGKIEAPGYLVVDDTLIPNYEKTVTDFRRYFEIEDVVERDPLQNTARQLIGFRSRDYLDDLLLTRNTQFQFYQGFIRQKGTRTVLDKFLRIDSSIVDNNVLIFEEWALREGEYGAVQDSIMIELLLKEDEWRAQPQLIEFKGSILNIAISDTDTTITVEDALDFPETGLIRIGAEQILYTAKSGNDLTGATRGASGTTAIAHNVGEFVGIIDNQFDDVITMANDDDRWILRPPGDGRASFPARNLSAAKRNKNAAYFFRTDNKVAGYPLETEITFRVDDIAERDELFDLQRITLEAEDLVVGDTIWVDNISDFYETNNPNTSLDDDPRAVFNFGFMVYRFTDLGLTFSLPKLPLNAGDPTVVLADFDHGFVAQDFVMIDKAEGTAPEINGSYIIDLVTSRTALNSFSSPVEGDTIVISGATVTLVGTTLDEIIDSINDANIANIIAFEDPDDLGKIKLVNIENEDIILDVGTPASTSGEGGQHATGQDIGIGTAPAPASFVLTTGTAEATGTSFATYTAGFDIIINGTNITFNGTDVESAIIDINNAGVTVGANFDLVTASKSNNALKISLPTTHETSVTAGLELAEEFFVTGSIGAIYANGDDILINGVSIVLSTGTTVADAIIDITAASLPGISAVDDGGALKIISTNIALVLEEGAGVALAALGFTEGTTNGVLLDLGFNPGITAVVSSVEDVVTDINAQGIPDILASNDVNTITIENTSDGDVVIDDGNTPDTILDDLGLTAGTFINALTLIGFTVGTFTTTDAKAFTIENNIQQDDNDGGTVLNGTINIFTESRFTNQATRNAAVDTRGNNIPWTTGEVVYVDERTNANDVVPLWEVYTFDGPGQDDWLVAVFDNVNRTQSDKIDVELFRQSLLYNKDTNVIDIRLNIWDPAKGLYPGQILDQIEYKVEYDSAKYTNGDETRFQVDPLESWGEAQVGQVWWDVSQSEYINYETGSNRQRRNNWGGLAAGKSITVYEWVRSTVPPTQWSDLVAQVENLPTEGFNNKPSGEAFFGDDDGAPFVQRIEINSTTNAEEIAFYFWVQNSESVPNLIHRTFSIAEIARQMTNPTAQGVPWWAAISEHAMIVSGIEALLTEEDSVLQVTYNFTQNPNNLHREWRLSREGDEKDIPTDRYWDKMVDSLVGFNIENSPVPDPNLEQSRRFGNFIRPRQTWFIDREEAGRIFVDCVNKQLLNQCIVDTRPNIFDNLFAKTADPVTYTDILPHPLGEDRPPCEYDFHVTNNTERDLLLTVPGLNDHDQVWVDGIPETNGFWKVYRNDPIDGFVEVCTEAFRLEDFWDQIDFFAEGFENVTPDITVDTVAERNALAPLVDGTIVRVNDSNSDAQNIWALYNFDTSIDFDPWVLVGKQDCTLSFDTALFSDPTYGNVDVLSGLDGRDLALKAILNALRTDISTDLEENLLFYKMINFVNSEQLLVDWNFKTSYIFVRGFDRAATQDPIITNDATDSFISFINEVKPYHTKLRDFITNEDFGLDVVSPNVTDFDKPVFFDEGLNEFRVLDPDDNDDKIIMADPDADQNDWFTNYIPNPELVRTFNTTILFDRVSCDIGSGWDPTFGWDFGPNENWDLTLSSSTTTAADRILKSYIPQPFSTEDLENDEIDPITDLTTLISGCDFRGTIVDGFDFNIADIDDVDSFLEGGPLANPGVPLDSSTIIVDGNLFRQPDFDSGHPEELILNVVGEAISLCVSTKKTIGAPNIRVRRFAGTSGAGPYDIGQQPASKEAVFVYVNGIRAENDDFEFDSINNTITFAIGNPITSNDFIVITSFSPGGAEGVIDIEYFSGDGINDTFTLVSTPPTADSVFATQNGNIIKLGVDYNIAGNDIIFTFIPALTDEFFITIFESNIFTTVLSTEHDVTGPLVAPASNTYSIGQDVNDGRIVEQDNVFVDVNGIRQRPFRPSSIFGWSDTDALWSITPWSDVIGIFDYDYTVNFATDEVIFINSLDGANNPVYTTTQNFFINTIEVILSGSTVEDAVLDINNATIPEIIASLDDTTTRVKIINVAGGPINLVEGSNTALVDLGFQPGDFESVLSVGDKIILSTLSNDYVLDRFDFDGVTTTFSTIQDLIIAEQVDVKIDGILVDLGVDFTVDTFNDEITLTPSLVGTMSIGDLIEILIYYTTTEVFDGNNVGPGNVGRYGVLAQVAIEPEKVFVYLNGSRQRDQIDYQIIDSGTKIQFFEGHTNIDEIIITIMTGRGSADPIAFRLFLNNLNSLNSEEIKPLAFTNLAADLSPVDAVVTLESTVGFPPFGSLIVLTGDGITITYEFIQYDNVTVNTVDVVQRGFNNTPASQHFTGDIVCILDPTIDGLADWEAFRISNINKAKLTQDFELADTEIHLDRVAGLPKQVTGQPRMTIPGVVWIENERIEFFERQGKVLKQIRRGTQGTSSGIPAVYAPNGDLIEDGLTGGTLTYPVGTTVTDGSKKQVIPGGYKFEITPFGLQFSNSAQAKFLRASPGTC